ncbi:hypothetical protein OH799_24895 [Nocardia sp. NBC_00881]|uniref:hypothetical protein n=1 Tax=Nocardia sp. NBC_00881 TaxID=2975995 RepID=UPI0038656B8F|nr:hypothetical protein OH799_24895 [Nocardia sp. NBC_00881]
MEEAALDRDLAIVDGSLPTVVSVRPILFSACRNGIADALRAEVPMPAGGVPGRTLPWGVVGDVGWGVPR